MASEADVTEQQAAAEDASVEAATPEPVVEADQAAAVAAEPVPAVTVDNTTRRSDDDALEGSFVRVIAGEHAGTVGAYLSTLEHDATTGYPTLVLVRNRDHAGDVDLFAVPYTDVRPAVGFNGGR